MNSCEDFEGLIPFLSGYTKTVITAAARIILLILPESFSGVVEQLLGWAAWDGFQIPEGAMHCLSENARYLLIFIVSIWAVCLMLDFLIEKQIKHKY